MRLRAEKRTGDGSGKIGSLKPHACISEALFEHLTPDELVAKALRTALDVVQAKSGSILLADPASQQLIFRHSIGESLVKAGTAIPWDKGIAGRSFSPVPPSWSATPSRTLATFPRSMS